MTAKVAVLGKFEKQPAEILDYDVDYTDWFSKSLLLLTQILNGLLGNLVLTIVISRLYKESIGLVIA